MEGRSGGGLARYGMVVGWDDNHAGDSAMQPLGQRILIRGVPIALLSAAIGYFVTNHGYKLAELFETVEVVRTTNYLGAVMFGGLAFATVAALECVRRPKKEAPKPGQGGHGAPAGS